MSNTVIKEINDAMIKQDVDRARQLLRPLLQEDNPTAEILYLASQVAMNQQQKETFLQKTMEQDPFHQEARNELKALQKLEIIDPTPAPPVLISPTPELQAVQKEESAEIKKNIRQMRQMFGFIGILTALYAAVIFLLIFQDPSYILAFVLSATLPFCFWKAYSGLGKRTRSGLNFARISSIIFLIGFPILTIFGIFYLVKLSKSEMKQTLIN